MLETIFLEHKTFSSERMLISTKHPLGGPYTDTAPGRESGKRDFYILLLFLLQLFQEDNVVTVACFGLGDNVILACHVSLYDRILGPVLRKCLFKSCRPL